jgi:hypothetical protein
MHGGAEKANNGKNNQTIKIEKKKKKGRRRGLSWTSVIGVCH